MTATAPSTKTQLLIGKDWVDAQGGGTLIERSRLASS